MIWLLTWFALSLPASLLAARFLTFTIPAFDVQAAQGPLAAEGRTTPRSSAAFSPVPFDALDDAGCEHTDALTSPRSLSLHATPISPEAKADHA